MAGVGTSPVLLVGGPTASGKSALGCMLAEALSGEILNIDSVQLYRNCDIGSAKPTPAERARVPHHLLDMLDPGEQITVAQCMRQAHEVLEDLKRAGRLPVVVGGTNLYLTALFHGLAEIPQGDPRVREELERRTSVRLYEELSQLDPETAQRLHPNDKLRIVRALETIRVSGHKPSLLHARHQFGETLCVGLVLVLCWEREKLYSRIDQRAHAMVKAGLLDETRRIVERFGADAPVLRALGYAQAHSVLQGQLAASELADLVALETRRFAKRQMTYWRNEPAKRGWATFPAAGEPAKELPLAEQKGAYGPAQKSFRVLSMGYDGLLVKVKQRLGQPFGRNEVWYLDAEALGG